jgi:hypothetical protein
MPFENSLKAKGKNSKGECWPVKCEESKACNGGGKHSSIIVFLVVPVPLALV